MDKFHSISTIRKKVKEYGKKIEAPSRHLGIRTTSDGFGAPYIEINENGYNYIVSERGVEHKREHTKDFDKFIYWIFKDIIFDMASTYELEHRRSNEDSRRQLFAKILELMEQLNPKFAIWEKEDLDKILKENPYMDEML